MPLWKLEKRNCLILKLCLAQAIFKNGIVEKWQLESLKDINPNIPTYDMGDGTYKVPSGWLIEQTGLKGQLLHGMRVYDKMLWF